MIIINLLGHATIRFYLSLFLILFLFGCSGSESNTNSIKYTGNTELADITLDNALEILKLSYFILNTPYVDDIGLEEKRVLSSNGNIISISQIKSFIKSRLSNQYNNSIKAKSISARNSITNYSYSEIINEREQCENAEGYMSYRGTVYIKNFLINGGLIPELVGFDLSISLNSCLIDGEIHHGSIQYFADERTFFEEISFESYTIQYINKKIELSGTVTYSVDSSGADLDVYNMIIKNLLDGEMVKFSNYTHRLIPQSYYENFLSAIEEFEGVIYHSTYGKIYVETVSPFGYEYYPVTFPGKNGVLRISGKADQYIEAAFVEGTSSAIIGDHNINLEVNTHNDNFVYKLSYNNITNNPAFASLNDSDGDQLPDTWESYYGLDPTNSDNALIDSDGDLINNLDEFYALTSPIDSNDHPDVAHLNLSIYQKTNLYPVDVPSPLHLRLKNMGPSGTNGSAMLELTYPASISARLPNWIYEEDCQEADEIITCYSDWGYLGDDWELKTTLYFSSSIVQDVNITATISAPLAKETQSVSVSVNYFMHDGYFQDIVDAAGSASTIQVPPGHYIAAHLPLLSYSVESISVDSNTRIVSMSGPDETYLYGIDLDLYRGAEFSGFTIHSIGSSNFNFIESCTVNSICDLPSDEFIFTNNRIYSNFHSIDFSFYGHNDKLFFSRNFIENAFTSIGGGMFTTFNTLTSAQFLNNIFVNINGTIFSDGGDIGLGYDETYSPGIKIINNTFSNNTEVYEFYDWSSSHSGTPASYSNRIFENNIFYSNDYVFKYYGYDDAILFAVNAPQLSHNIFHLNTEDITNFEIGFSLSSTNLSVDPIFADIALNDFTPLTGSPAIDAGKAGLILDFYGNLRPEDGNLDGIFEVDIGAIEYNLNL